MDGAAQGPEAVRATLLAIRSLYEDQEFNFAGPYGENGWIEDYVAQVNGERIGCVVLITAAPMGRRDISRRTTGYARPCCFYHAWWARSSLERPTAITSLPTSSETISRTTRSFKRK